MYELYLGAMLCPVTPSKINIKIKGQNKTMNLINESEINVLKKPGLSDIDFDLLLPNVKYPFAIYEDGFQNAKYFLNIYEHIFILKKYYFCVFAKVYLNEH